MKRHLTRTALLFTLTVAAFAEPAPQGSEPPPELPPTAGPSVASGDRMQPLRLSDQFDQPRVLDGDTRLLILAAGMQAGSAASEVLREAGEGCYTSPALFYVADISRMPRRIADRFAIPKMREGQVPVALVRDDAVDNIPREADKVTLLALDDFVVTRVEMVEPEAVGGALVGVCP